MTMRPFMSKDDLRKFIDDSGLTRTEFAYWVGCTTATLNNYLRGFSRIPRTLQRLALKYPGPAAVREELNAEEG